MSSSAIMVIIKQKEAELAQLKSTKAQVVLLNDAVSCTAFKFEKAGNLMSEAGSIGGRPYDNGATLEVGQNFKNVSVGTETLLNDISTKITNLETEISSLYQQYYAALKREEEERKAREQAAWYARNKKV